MKIAFLTFAVFLGFGSSNAFAARERKCTEEVLTCRLEKQLISGGKIFLQEKSEKFSGFNAEEPSVEPEQCLLHLSMQKGAIHFNVKIGDSDYMASIFTINDNNHGRVLPGAVSFLIVKGQTFHYLYDKLVLSCSLN